MAVSAKPEIASTAYQSPCNVTPAPCRPRLPGDDIEGLILQGTGPAIPRGNRDAPAKC